MDTAITKSLGLTLTQIAWVVKDIETTLTFFQEELGIKFSKVDTIRVKEFGATYYGKPSNAESLVSLAYSDGIFIEMDKLINRYLQKEMVIDYVKEVVCY